MRWCPALKAQGARRHRPADPPGRQDDRGFHDRQRLRRARRANPADPRQARPGDHDRSSPATPIGPMSARTARAGARRPAAHQRRQEWLFLSPTSGWTFDRRHATGNSLSRARCPTGQSAAASAAQAPAGEGAGRPLCRPPSRRSRTGSSAGWRARQPATRTTGKAPAVGSRSPMLMLAATRGCRAWAAPRLPWSTSRGVRIAAAGGDVTLSARSSRCSRSATTSSS